MTFQESFFLKKNKAGKKKKGKRKGRREGGLKYIFSENNFLSERLIIHKLNIYTDRFLFG